MKEEELRKKVKKLKLDHIAAGGFISDEEAKKVIKEVYDLESGTKRETPSRCSCHH